MVRPKGEPPDRKMLAGQINLSANIHWCPFNTISCQPLLAQKMAKIVGEIWSEYSHASVSEKSEIGVIIFSKFVVARVRKCL